MTRPATPAVLAARARALASQPGPRQPRFRPAPRPREPRSHTSLPLGESPPHRARGKRPARTGPQYSRGGSSPRRARRAPLPAAARRTSGEASENHRRTAGGLERTPSARRGVTLGARGWRALGVPGGAVSVPSASGADGPPWRPRTRPRRAATGETWKRRQRQPSGHRESPSPRPSVLSGLPKEGGAGEQRPMLLQWGGREQYSPDRDELCANATSEVRRTVRRRGPGPRPGHLRSPDETSSGARRQVLPRVPVVVIIPGSF